MNIEEHIKDSPDYKAIEHCLHYLDGHDEMLDICEALELAKSIMLSDESYWQEEFISDLDTDNPEEFVPRRE